MLSEVEVRRLYTTAQQVVVNALKEVTIDIYVTEAMEHCKAFAEVLGEVYVAPKRAKRGLSCRV